MRKSKMMDWGVHKKTCNLCKRRNWGNLLTSHVRLHKRWKSEDCGNVFLPCNKINVGWCPHFSVGEKHNNMLYFLWFQKKLFLAVWCFLIEEGKGLWNYFSMDIRVTPFSKKHSRKSGNTFPWHRKIYIWPRKVEKWTYFPWFRGKLFLMRDEQTWFSTDLVFHHAA